MDLRPELEAALCWRLVRRTLLRGAAVHLEWLDEVDWRRSGRLFAWF